MRQERSPAVGAGWERSPAPFAEAARTRQALSFLEPRALGELSEMSIVIVFLLQRKGNQNRNECALARDKGSEPIGEQEAEGKSW